MQIDPRHPEIVRAIVDRGGPTEGSERLGKSQPSVARTVAALEARLGAPLLVPGRRPLRPTPFGPAPAAEGERVAEARRTAEVAARSHASGRASTVRLAGTPLFMDGVVAPMVAEFQRLNPGLGIDQGRGHPADLPARLEAGALALAGASCRCSRGAT